MRVGAVVQAVILGLLALVVLDAAGIAALGWTESMPWLAWVPVMGLRPERRHERGDAQSGRAAAMAPGRDRHAGKQPGRGADRRLSPRR